jgi:peroxiredoxin
MTLALTKGQTIDLGIVYRINDESVHESVNISELFEKKRLLVFMGPAPFSRLDTEQAIDYERHSKDILDQKIDEIIGLYVQDAFVMDKFQEHVRNEVKSKNVKFYGDGDGFFVKANNLMHDFTCEGLSTRCGRWAFIVNDGVVEYVTVDDYSTIDTTSPTSILKYLKNET